MERMNVRELIQKLLEISEIDQSIMVKVGKDTIVDITGFDVDINYGIVIKIDI